MKHRCATSVARRAAFVATLFSPFGCVLHISQAPQPSLPTRTIVAPRPQPAGAPDGPSIARATDVLQVVLASDEFYQRDASVWSLSRGVLKGTVSGEDFARHYLLAAHSDTILDPFVIQIDNALNSNGATGWNGRDAMVVRLDANWRTRANASTNSSLALFGCAINTLAHERVHTIRHTGDGSTASYYTDGPLRRRAPLASYTVGSIAHCTFFRLYGSLPEESFWTCVERMGTTDFWRNACSENDHLIGSWSRPCTPGVGNCRTVPTLVPQTPSATP